MNIINIVLKEVKQSFRDKKNIAMMILLPIVLMIILGMSLSKEFSNDFGSSNIKVLYIIECNNPVAEAFKSFIANEHGASITFIEVKNAEEGKQSIQEAKYTSFVEVKEDKIQLYKNNRFNYEASLVECIFNIFVDRYNLTIESMKVNPAAINMSMNGNTKKYTNLISLDGKRSPTSTDYYAVTMLTLIIMYSSMHAAHSIKSEKISKTGNRLLVSPIKKYEILIGKIIGSLVTSMMQAIVLVIFSKYALNAYWGEHLGAVLLIICTQIVMTISIGICTAFIVENPNIMDSILNIAIPVAGFLGGAYFPINELKNKMAKLFIYISPLKWNNEAIFQIIYGENFKAAFNAIIINMVISSILIIIASVKFKKEGMRG